jgi:5-methylcytosine-specific restriction enzyme A
VNPQKVSLLKAVLEDGIGTGVIVTADKLGPRSGLSCHFSELKLNRGPVCSVFPTGLLRHRVSLRFGSFSSECIEQMQSASEEQHVVARALLRSVADAYQLEFRQQSQSLDSWRISGSDFGIDVIVRDVPDPASEVAIERTAKLVMVPIMASMAELIGYDEVTSDEPIDGDEEGLAMQATIHRRERSRRNRLLCLMIHGHRCVACGVVPADKYGHAGTIIQVHHLQPLMLCEMSRIYDPRTDLVPLCPNCHAAIHTRRPIPYSIEELKEIINRAGH